MSQPPKDSNPIDRPEAGDNIEDQAIALEIFEFGLRGRTELGAPLLLNQLSKASDPIAHAIGVTMQIIGISRQLLQEFGCDLGLASTVVLQARESLLAGESGEDPADAR